MPLGVERDLLHPPWRDHPKGESEQLGGRVFQGGTSSGRDHRKIASPTQISEEPKEKRGRARRGPF
jgi:hypothetical protein